MVKYVAGIDAGTTGLKTIIFDLKGHAVGKAYEEYPCITPRVGWVEQDVYCLWRALCHTVRGAILDAGVDPTEIGSVGISSQRGTFFAIDEDWEPLHNSIVWSDGRAVEEVKWIKENIGVEKYHQISGAPVSGAWSYGKYKWVRDHEPELYEKAWKFVNAQEWLLHKLGSTELFTDPASLALNGMMDVATLDWSDELLEAIDFSKEKLPPVKEPARQVGTVSKIAAEATGFAEGMPICVGGGDQQCAAIGCGVIKEGMAEITIGTASVMVAAVDGVKEDPQHEVIFSGHAVPGHMDMEGLAYATGVALRWWRDIYGMAETVIANSTHRDPYDIICEEAEQSPVGSKGYLFLPFFSGQVTPYYHDNARGGSLGISLAHDRDDMARAVLEGGAYELRMIVEAMERVLGRPFDVIRLSGGGSKSPLWRQILADVFGRPVQCLKVADCGVLGAAILGASGAGVFSSLEEAVDSMVHATEMVQPNLDNYDLYTDMYGIFKDAFVAWKDAGIYDRLNEVCDKYWND